jgi:hypothetical protein
MTWQQIETAPRDREEDDDYAWVIVYQPEGLTSWVDRGKVVERRHREAVRVAHCEDDGQWWTGSSYDSEQMWPTHWMPLPDPPVVEPT